MRKIEIPITLDLIVTLIGGWLRGVNWELREEYPPNTVDIEDTRTNATRKPSRNT